MSENMKLQGSLHQLEDTQTFNSGFTKREFVLKTNDGKYDQFIKFEAVQDKVKELDGYKTGDEMAVNFNIRGREHNGRFFNNLVAWRIENLAGQSSVQSKPAAKQDDDEIPF